MQPNDRGKFAVLMMGMCATFRTEPEEALLAGYWMALEDMSIGAFEVAVKRGQQECGYLPKPVKLRKFGGLGSGEDNGEAWEGVLEQIRRVGSYGKPEFSPDVREAVVACGGWKRLCSATTEDLHNWIRKEFAEALASRTERAKAERYLPTIPETLRLPGVKEPIP